MTKIAEFMALLDATANPSIQAIVTLVEMFYELPGNSVGGSLHVVVDDRNWERALIEFCRVDAKVNGDIPAERFADLLLTLTETQLAELAEVMP